MEDKLLLETGDAILQEDGDYILLDVFVAPEPPVSLGTERLLQEDGFALLQESGSYILLDERPLASTLLFPLQNIPATGAYWGMVYWGQGYPINRLIHLITDSGVLDDSKSFAFGFNNEETTSLADTLAAVFGFNRAEVQPIFDFLGTMWAAILTLSNTEGITDQLRSSLFESVFDFPPPKVSVTVISPKVSATRVLEL